MKKLRWQLIIIFLTGLVVGILLLGEQPGIQSIMPEATKGGIYSEALVGSLQRLNPILDYHNDVDRDIDYLIFSGLIRFDVRGVPQPDLVESWGISKDGTLYNFTLRSDVKWHNGEPLTSDDVLFTIDLLRKGSPYVPVDIEEFWEEIEVKNLSENTLQFRLPEPFSPFLDYLAFGILPRHLLGDYSLEEIVDAAFNFQPVGSGPFKFNRLIVEGDQVTGMVLDAFEEYYAKKPFIDQIIFRYYPDAISALEAYREGDVQGIGSVTEEILLDVLADPNLAVYTGRNPELTLIILNLNNPQVPFFEDASVRRALLLGLNRQWMINKLLHGQGIVAEGPILPGTWAYYDDIDQIGYDPQEAKYLLKEAGYVVFGEQETVRQNEDIALSFKLIYPDDELHHELAEMIQSNWAILDVQVELEALAYEELVDVQLENRSYHAALVDLNLARAPDPDPYPFWDQAQATGGQNYSQWDNRMASEYIEQARVKSELDDRIRLYRNFQVIFSEELPALLLFYPVYTYTVDYQVQGVQMGPLFDCSDRFATISDWFLVAKQPSQSSPTSIIGQ